MASLKTLVEDIKDPNDYDGVIFICTKGGGLANLGFSGSVPQGIPHNHFVYRCLMEAGYAVAFNEEDNGSKATEH